MCRCDTVPEKYIGRQFGIIVTGATVGTLVGPPVAGPLYQRWGFRAPFIFSVIVAGIDLVGRLLLIKRHEAIRWGVDPMAIPANDNEDREASGAATSEKAEEVPVTEPQSSAKESPRGDSTSKERARSDELVEQLQEPIRSRVASPPHIIVLRLMKSPRATACILLSFMWGLIWNTQDTTIVLHMNRVWGLDPHWAGIVPIAIYKTRFPSPLSLF